MFEHESWNEWKNLTVNDDCHLFHGNYDALEEEMLLFSREQSKVSLENKGVLKPPIESLDCSPIRRSTSRE